MMEVESAVRKHLLHTSFETGILLEVDLVSSIVEII